MIGGTDNGFGLYNEEYLAYLTAPLEYQALRIPYGSEYVRKDDN